MRTDSASHSRARKRAKNRKAYRLAMLRFDRSLEADWCYTPRLSWVALFEPVRGEQ